MQGNKGRRRGRKKNEREKELLKAHVSVCTLVDGGW
jgi:hypothetical protein